MLPTGREEASSVVVIYLLDRLQAIADKARTDYYQMLYTLGGELPHTTAHIGLEPRVEAQTRLVHQLHLSLWEAEVFC